MTDTALVTIGIPSFNSARWLQAAIESALAQTWPNREVIVVDDGSIDHSKVIASAFGDHIKFITSDHYGATFARNLILQEARGEWVQFLDADDLLLPGKITQQLAEANGGQDADVIYSPVLVETTTGKTVDRVESEIDPNLDLYARWLAWQLPQTGGSLWRRSALEEIGFWKKDQPCCQEHELYLRALKAKLRFVFTPTPGAIYRIWSEDTLCRKDPSLVVRVKAALIDEMVLWLKEQKLWSDTHRRIAGQACFEMARTLARINLKKAVAFHHDRRSRRLMDLRGPAAPTAYKLAYNLLGFAGAERFARILR